MTDQLNTLRSSNLEDSGSSLITPAAAEQENTVKANLEANCTLPFHIRDIRRKLDLACTALRHYHAIDRTLGVESVAGKALGEVGG